MSNWLKKNWKHLLIAVVLLAACAYSGIKLYQYMAHSVSTRKANEELASLYEEQKMDSPQEKTEETQPSEQLSPFLPSYQYIGTSTLPSIAKIQVLNPDTVAWLYIPGVVNLPVVYRDNIYYLDHDFNGNRSESGSLFLDENHPFVQDTQYLVIHGHNWHDGSMFGTLSHYRKNGYMEEHQKVFLNSLYREEEYEVIGVLSVSIDSKDSAYIPYVGIRKFDTIEQFETFRKIIMERALYWANDARLEPHDALLALSTCYKDERIVVMCRRVSPNF